jgi:hypothetical protein
MGFLSKLFGKTERPTAVQRTPALAPLIAAIADPQSMWPGFYGSLRGHWDLRGDAAKAVVLHWVTKLPKEQREATLGNLVAADPASWLPVRAEFFADEAASARGSDIKIADEKMYRHYLNVLQADAVAMLNGDPQDPLPATHMQLIARYTGDDGLAANMYAEGQRRAPSYYALHFSENSRLSQRWGGSHAAQLAHARHVAGSAAHGSLAAGLPIVAQFFHLSHFMSFDNDHKGAAAWAANPAVLDELRNVCARSIDDPSHQVTAATFRLRTYAALIGGQCQAVDFIKRQYVGLVDVYIHDAWRQLNPDPQPMFDMYRKMYGQS